MKNFNSIVKGLQASCCTYEGHELNEPKWLPRKETSVCFQNMHKKLQTFLSIHIIEFIIGNDLENFLASWITFDFFPFEFIILDAE